MLDVDSTILAATFASAVQLAKKTEDEVVIEAIAEWRSKLKWISSTSKQPGSFIWTCIEFDLDPDCVRKAIKEKRA